jgi:AraC-like DNA-binding protein
MKDSLPADNRKISLLRAQLECFAARQMALQSDSLPDAMGELQDILSHLNKAIGQQDYPAFREADFRLHETIVRSAGIPLLHECWLAVWKGLAKFHHSSYEECWPDLQILSREHEYLVESIGLQDPIAAEDAARTHIEAVWLRIAGLGDEESVTNPLQRAEAFLAFRYPSPLSLEEVASRAAYTSPGNLSRLFRQRHGVGFQEYLQKLRLAKAAELLLTTGLSVAHIAHRVGYNDISRFGQHFKRHYDVTPTRWRKTPPKAGENRV